MVSFSSRLAPVATDAFHWLRNERDFARGARAARGRRSRRTRNTTCPALARRLAIRGSNITLPDGKPARLRGFNLLFQLDTMYNYPRTDTDGPAEAAAAGCQRRAPRMLHWDDRPTEDAGPNNENDCSEVQRAETMATQFASAASSSSAALRWTARPGLVGDHHGTGFHRRRRAR